MLQLSWIVWEDERAFAIDRRTHELIKDGVFRLLSWEPVDGFEELLLRIFEIEVLISHY